MRRPDDKAADVVPLVFAEVHLPKVPDGVKPRLKGRLPESAWVFNWDARRKVGYLLALPKAGEKGELRWRVEYDAPSVAVLP